MTIKDFIKTIDVRSTVDIYAEEPIIDNMLAATFGSETMGIEIYKEVTCLYDNLEISKINYRADKRMENNIIIIINFKKGKKNEKSQRLE